MTRRDFIGRLTGAAAASALAGCAAPRVFTGARGDFDDGLAVFIADLHVRDASCYQYVAFATCIAEILRMDPLPRHVVVFGDIAYQCGLPDEYATSAPLLRSLSDAGIDVVFGMGNHDRRSAFLETYPEFAKRLLLDGRIVSNTDLGPVDLLMLDGLQGTDERGRDDMGSVAGAFDIRQQEWILDRLGKLTRPTLVASHFPLEDLVVCGKKLVGRLSAAPQVAGYVYGHKHRWKADWFHRDWKNPDIVRSLCLPSTGHWGDIGHVVVRLRETEARAEFVQRDFYAPKPASVVGRSESWADIFEEQRARHCTFRWKRTLS